MVASADGIERAVERERDALLHDARPAFADMRPAMQSFAVRDAADVRETLEASLLHLAAAAAICGRMVEDNTSFIALAASRGDRIARLNAENATSLDRLTTGGRGG